MVITQLFCGSVNHTDCTGRVTKEDYLETSYYSSAFSGTNQSVHHYQCPACQELVGSNQLIESQEK